jgi:hypothetical protein
MLFVRGPPSASPSPRRCLLGCLLLLPVLVALRLVLWFCLPVPPRRYMRHHAPSLLQLVCATLTMLLPLGKHRGGTM